MQVVSKAAALAALWRRSASAGQALAKRRIPPLALRRHVRHPAPVPGRHRALQARPAGPLRGQDDAERQQRAALEEEDAADVAAERAQPAALLRDPPGLYPREGHRARVEDDQEGAFACFA